MADYVLISVGGNKVEYWTSPSGFTEIPGFAVPSYNYPLCVSGTIDDLWIGMAGSGVTPYDKPYVRRWNGSSWVNYFFTAFPPAGSPGVGAIYRVSATEVYALANAFGSANARLYVWDGAAWTDKGGTQLYGYDVQNRMFKNGTRIFFTGYKPSSYYDRYYRYDAGVINNDSDGDASVNCVAVEGRDDFDHMYSYKANGKLRVKQYGGAWSQIAQDSNPAWGGLPGQCIQSTESYVWTCFYDYSMYRVRLNRRDAVTGANLVSVDTGSTKSGGQVFILGDGEWQWVASTTGYRRRQGLSGSWINVARGYAPNCFTGYEESETDPPTIENEDPAPGEVGVDPYKFVRADVVDRRGVGVDPATVVIKVNKLIVWISDAVVLAGWIVQKTTITDGFRYIITAPGRFSYGSVVEITWLACDLNGNCL